MKNTVIYKERKPLVQKIVLTIIGMMFIVVGIGYMIYTSYSIQGFISVFFGTGFGINLIIQGIFD